MEIWYTQIVKILPRLQINILMSPYVQNLIVFSKAELVGSNVAL